MHFLKTKIVRKLTLNLFSPSEFGLWLLIPFACLISHTWLPLPPTMLLLFGAIAVWIIQQIKPFQQTNATQNDMRNFTQNAIILFSLFTLYLLISQYFIDASLRRYMGAILAPLYLIFTLLFSKNVSLDFLKKQGDKFMRYSLIILSFEAILRYVICFYKIFTGTNYYQGFYQFKFYSPMYVASNTVAVLLILLLFFILWWGKVNKKSIKKEACIATILLALTLSRASIPAFFGGMFYYAFFRNVNWKKALLVCSTFVIVAFFGLLALKSVLADGSFQSKFQIFSEALDYYKTASLKNILFGLGFYESETVMSYYAHNYFLLFLMETGIFGFLLLLATLLFLIITTNGAAMIVLLPFSIQVSADGTTFIPYFYVIMALMILISTKHDSKKDTLLLD